MLGVVHLITPGDYQIHGGRISACPIMEELRYVI